MIASRSNFTKKRLVLTGKLNTSPALRFDHQLSYLGHFRGNLETHEVSEPGQCKLRANLFITQQ